MGFLAKDLIDPSIQALHDGSLTENQTPVKGGLALSSTELLLKFNP